MKSEKENNIFDDGLFDTKLNSLFENYNVSNIPPNWTKMSNALNNAEMDDILKRKLSEHEEKQSSEWDNMSSELDHVYNRRKNIIIKQILELSLALLLLLLFGQGFNFLINTNTNQTLVHVNNNENTTHTEKNLKNDKTNSHSNDNNSNSSLLTKDVEDNSIGVAIKTDSPNILENRITSSIKDASIVSVGNIVEKSSKGQKHDVVSIQNQVKKEAKTDILSKNILSSKNDIATSLTIQTKPKSIQILNYLELLKMEKLDYQKKQIDFTNAQINRQWDHLAIKAVTKKKKFSFVPFLGIDMNNISYPKHSFYRGIDTFPRYTWEDTVVKSRNINYGLSFMMPKKNWILEVSFSKSTKTSKLNKSYTFGYRLNELATWTLLSERFDIYSLGININPVIARTNKITGYAILGTKLNIIYNYSADTLLNAIDQGEVDPNYIPQPKTPDEVSGNALFRSNNSGQSDNYSYVALTLGIGAMIEINSNVSIDLRTAYNYNYLNRYIGRTTARINTLNTRLGIMFNF